MNGSRCVMDCCNIESGFNFRTYSHVSHDLKMIYYKIPKAASTSMAEYLDEYGFIAGIVTPQEISNTYPDYFQFSISRNPYSRFVSAWNYTRNNINVHMRRYFSEKGVNIEGITFNDFVEFSQNHRNHHWEVARVFVPNKLDFILKLENLKDDMKIIENKVQSKIDSKMQKMADDIKIIEDKLNTKIDLNLERIKVYNKIVLGHRKHDILEDWRSFYTQDIKDKVYNLYKCDFNRFNYERD